MILIVDGYNLIKSALGISSISEKFRNDFISILNNYAKIKEHKIILVFDGGSYSYPSKQNFDQVTVVYSGYNSSADDTIISIMDEKRSRDILLITSDRELRKFALNISIDSVSSLEFYDFVKNLGKVKIESKSDKTLHKTSNDNSLELDQLMQEGTKQIQKKEEIFHSNRNKKNDMLSKREKKIDQKLRKL